MQYTHSRSRIDPNYTWCNSFRNDEYDLFNSTAGAHVHKSFIRKQSLNWTELLKIIKFEPRQYKRRNSSNKRFPPIMTNVGHA